MTEVTLWHGDSEGMWIASLRPTHRYEIDLGRFATPDEAIEHLNRWADQRGLVIVSTEPWLDGGVNRFKVQPNTERA